MTMDMESGPNANVPEEPPELRFRLAQVTPVMGPTSGGEWLLLEFSGKGFLRTRNLSLLSTAGAN